MTLEPEAGSVTGETPSDPAGVEPASVPPDAAEAAEDPDHESRPETLYAACNVNVRGWDNDDEDEARAFAGTVLGLARAFSKYLDLSRLESIVIGYDYPEALASVTGAATDSAPTVNEYGEGSAMAVTVVRDDQPWKVVVIWTPLVRQIADETHENHKLALHTFWHELVHVDDLQYFATTFPGGWRAARERNAMEGAFMAMVNPCQSEYSAARKSAFFKPDYGHGYLEMLEASLKDVDEQIREARIAYRLHGDMGVLWPIVTERVRFLFQAMGYALGHVDGVGHANDADGALMAQYEERLAKAAALPSGWILEETRKASQTLFDTNPWPSLDVFSDLIGIAEKLINQFGLYPRVAGEDLYIDAPYTSILDL
jgi:hypothetical protein